MDRNAIDTGTVQYKGVVREVQFRTRANWVFNVKRLPVVTSSLGTSTTSLLMSSGSATHQCPAATINVPILRVFRSNPLIKGQKWPLDESESNVFVCDACGRLGRIRCDGSFEFICARHREPGDETFSHLHFTSSQMQRLYCRPSLRTSCWVAFLTISFAHLRRGRDYYTSSFSVLLG